jgi:hypothetical protein
MNTPCASRLRRHPSTHRVRCSIPPTRRGRTLACRAEAKLARAMLAAGVRRCRLLRLKSCRHYSLYRPACGCRRCGTFPKCTRDSNEADGSVVAHPDRARARPYSRPFPARRRLLFIRQRTKGERCGVRIGSEHGRSIERGVDGHSERSVGVDRCGGQRLGGQCVRGQPIGGHRYG